MGTGVFPCSSYRIPIGVALTSARSLSVIDPTLPTWPANAAALSDFETFRLVTVTLGHQLLPKLKATPAPPAPIIRQDFLQLPPRFLFLMLEGILLHLYCDLQGSLILKHN